jgi:hypothetical protein
MVKTINTSPYELRKLADEIERFYGTVKPKKYHIDNIKILLKETDREDVYELDLVSKDDTIFNDINRTTKEAPSETKTEENNI